MKIGMSFGQCIRDIVNDEVNINDVLLIMAQTDFQPVTMDRVIDAYGNREGYLKGLDLDACKEVAQELLTSGRIFQPRNNHVIGDQQKQAAQLSIWFDLAPSATNSNPAIKEAWDQYRMVAGLVGASVSPNVNYRA